MASEYERKLAELRAKGGPRVDILDPKDNPRKEAANKDLSAAVKKDEGTSLFGRGILNASNRKPNATGKGTGSMASVGRKDYKAPASSGGGAKAAPMPATKPAAPKAAAKPAKKAAAPAKKKMREDTQANMTRVGMKESNGPKKMTGNGPKRVSPGSAAIKAAQPNRNDYRGAMVLRGPEKSVSGLRRSR